MKIGTVEVNSGLLPEGHVVLKVESIDTSKYEDFGKLSINLVTKSGQKHVERFQFQKADGSLNEGAQKAWSYWVGVILDQWGAGEADTDELVGKYIQADVEHVESDTVSDKTGKPFVNVRLNNMKSADGFDSTDDEENEAPSQNDDVEDDLDDLDDL
ncbi:MAG: hypothetical protein ABF630_09365 [Liquorilactobacillus sp.]